MLYVIGNALNLLDPEQTSTPLSALAVTCLVLAFVGLLALAIASVRVYGDEEIDEPTRRT